jgi:polyhydroxyalkanoate synthesis regulator phasin
MAKSKKEKKNLLMHETLVLGLALLDMTREKVEKVVSDATKGISEQDKKKAVDRLIKYARDSRKKAEEVVSKQIKRVLDEVGLEVKKKKK